MSTTTSADDQVPLFGYTAGDVAQGLVYTVKENSFEKSKFDELLCQQWDQAMAAGIFRYDLSGVVTRPVLGKYGFIVQRNSKRATHRRAPGKMLTLQQPYDPTTFNFNRIDPKEILLELRPAAAGGNREGEQGEEIDTKRDCHLMIVNVSPITYGHTLLVPSPKHCLPQVLTEDSIRLCLDMVALSHHSGFSVVANSLLAYASVNHLHYHILYVQEKVLASSVGGRHIGGCAYELNNHPSPGFGFQVVDTTGSCAREIFSFVSVLLTSNIPHNMVILRGRSFGSQESPAQVIRALLIPRQPYHGDKCGSPDSPHQPFNAAACEMAQGFVPVIDDSKYPTLSEDEILDILRKMILPEEEFQHLLDKVKLLYSSANAT